MSVEVLRERLEQARSDERGGVISIFLVITFLTLILFAGAGIDFMRFESERTACQAHLDNAVLAAAALRVNADKTPTQIVEEYMTKSNASCAENVVLTKSEVALGARHIEAEAPLSVGTSFVQLAGLASLETIVSSGAQERAPNLEVSLVLDISGSMTDEQRLEKLIPAAVSFVEGLLPANSTNNSTSVNIIPYSHGISLGPDLWQSVFTEQGGIGGSWCAEFEESAFDTLAKPTDSDAEPMPQFARSYSGTDTSTWTLVDEDGLFPNKPYCREDDLAAQVTVAANNASVLKTQIEGLTGGGWTSIHDAAKWGFALLDPSMQSVFADMTQLDASNPKRVPSVFSSGLNVRPAAYDDETTMKILVLMTDGANTKHYEIKPEYRPSVDQVTGDEILSGVFYRPEGEAVDANGVPIVDGNGDPVVVGSDMAFDATQRRDNPENPNITEVELSTEPYVELGWDELWERVSTRFFEYERGLDSDTVADLPLSSTDMDDRTKDLCDLAREDGGDGEAKVVVFTISYLAPPEGENLMSYCASQPSFAYKSDTNTIENDFQSILEAVVKLRLSK